MKVGDILLYSHPDINLYTSICGHCLAPIDISKPGGVYSYQCGMELTDVRNGYEITGVCNTLKVTSKKEERCISECSCDLFTVLMVCGCNCGAAKREKEMKGRN